MQENRLDDPLFKQRYRFSRDGETLRIEMWTDPGGGVRAEHVHPVLEERYEVIEGEITLNLDGRSTRLGPSERAVVPPGVRHSFENTGERRAHLVAEAEPAQELREAIEDAVRLARSERFSDSGSPRSLRALVEAAALARALPRDCRAHVPAAVAAAHPVPTAGALRPELTATPRRRRV